MAESQSAYLLSPPGRVAFQSVYHKKDWGKGQEPQYELTLVFFTDQMTPKDQQRWQALKDLVDFHKAKLGSKANGPKLTYPIYDGNFEPYEEMNGGWKIKFKDKAKPDVLDLDKQEIEEHTDRFYTGCWARVSFEPWSYDNVSYGVNMRLGHIMKVADDERWELAGNKGSSEDAFAEIEAGDTSVEDEVSDMFG